MEHFLNTDKTVFHRSAEPLYAIAAKSDASFECWRYTQELRNYALQKALVAF